MKKSIKEVIQGLLVLFVLCLIVNTPAVHALYMTQSKPVVTIKNNTAEIEWKTDVNSTGVINYGHSHNNLTQSSDATKKSKQHSVLLTGLLYGSSYYYTIKISNGTEEKVLGETNPYLFVTEEAPSVPEEGEEGETQLILNIPEYYNEKLMAVKGNASKNIKKLMFYVNPTEETIYGRGGTLALIMSDGSFVTNIPLEEKNKVVAWAGDMNDNELLRRSYNVTLDTKPPSIDFTMPNASAITDMRMNAVVDEPVYIRYYVANTLNESDYRNGTEYIEPDEDGNISFNIMLSDQHTNYVKIRIEDRAGNGKEWESFIDVMPEAPRIYEHNLDALTPSYAQEVKVKGNVTPNTIVLIRVNGKESPKGAFSTSFFDVVTNADQYIEQDRYIAKVGEDGLFKIEIMLTQELYETSMYDTDTYQETYGEAPPHFDEQDDKPMVGGEEYGIKTSFENKVEIIVIDRLGRNASLQQTIMFAKCGFGSDWNIEVSDFVPSAITPSLLREGLAQVSFSAKYDWQGPGEKVTILGPPTVTLYEMNEEDRKKYAIDPMELVKTPVRPSASADYKEVGYVVEFNKIDKPVEYWHNLTKKKDYEEYLVKVPLRAEIRYQYEDVFGNTVEKIQRHCFETTVFLDIQIPPDTIPTNLLKGSITALNKTINVIDKILEPLKTVTLWAFIGCLVSWVWLFFMYINQWSSCSGENKHYKSSQECKEAVDNRWSYEQKMQWLCDRSFCPSALTYNKYVEEEKKYWQEHEGSLATLDDKPPECYLNPVPVSEATKEEGCGKEYYETFNSACVIMNELDRSKCIEDPNDPDCGGAEKVWYAVSGFCEPKGEEKEIVVKRKDYWYQYDPNDAEANGRWCRGEPGSMTERIEKDPGKQGTYTKVSEDFICDGDYITEEEAVELGLMKGGKKDYVVDPTAGFLLSLQCVCLPAITGYLQLIRNVMNAIMQCFQSILITGEGKAGLCRSVLTVYICDLLFDAIRCFVNRMAGGTGSANRGGVAGFLQNVADAGESTRESIVNRYGKTALYRSMFDERKLIHAICLFAFTGDFDFDIMGALTGAGAVPLNSEAFVHPATRRFMGSNPTTGYATWVYHLGIGIVAGADLRYGVNLVCSNGDVCSSEDGFPNNRCDCFGMPEPKRYPITSHVGGGNIKAGSFLGGQGPEGDVYVKIQNQKYRYDRVEIWYEWKNNMGEKVRDSMMRPIRRIGDEPPVECKFDMMSAAFMCQYNIGDLGAVEFTRTPQPIKDRFYLNDNIVVDFQINKQAPTERDIEEPIPAVLIYRIRDHNGKLLEFEDGRTEQQKMLIEDRAYFSTDLGNIPYYKVTMSDFTGETQSDVQCTGESGSPSLDARGGGGTCVKGKISGKAHGKAVRFKEHDSRIYCTLHEMEGNNNEIQDKNKAWTDKDQEADMTTAGGLEKYECYGAMIKLEDTEDIEEDASYFVKIVSKSKEAEESPRGCRDYTQTRPAKWKVDLELHYCESSSNDTQPTFDNCEVSPDIVSSRGQPQAYTGQNAIPVKIVCGESEESQLKNCSDMGLVNTMLDQNCICQGIIAGPDIGGANYCLYKEKEDGEFEEDVRVYRECTLKDAKMTSPNLICDCNGDGFMECGTGRVCQYNEALDEYECSEAKCTPENENEVCAKACEFGGVCRYGVCRCNEPGTTEGRQECINKGYTIDIGDKYLHKCISETRAEGCDPETGEITNQYDIESVQIESHRRKLQEACMSPENKCRSQGFDFSLEPNDGYLYDCISATKVQGCKLSTGDLTLVRDIASFNPNYKQQLSDKCTTAETAAEETGCKIPSGKKIAFVGDSLTAGKKYQKYFYGQCPDKPPNEFRTFATVGHTSTQVYNDHIIGQDGAISWNPDYTIVLAGGNNIGNPNRIIKDLKLIYEKLADSGSDVVAVTITPWKGHRGWNDLYIKNQAEYQENTDQVNNWILTQAEANKADHVVNAYPVLDGPDSDDKLMSQYDGGDHIHLSNVGYQKLGETIYNNIAWT